MEGEPTETVGPLFGDYCDKPVRRRVWLNRTRFDIDVTVASGEVEVRVWQREGILFYKLVGRYDVPEGSTSSNTFPAKRKKADFRLTCHVTKRDAEFTYAWKAPSA